MNKILSMVLTALYTMFTEFGGKFKEQGDLGVYKFYEKFKEAKPLLVFMLDNGFEEEDLIKCLQEGRTDVGAVENALIQPQRRLDMAEGTDEGEDDVSADDADG